MCKITATILSLILAAGVCLAAEPDASQCPEGPAVTEGAGPAEIDLGRLLSTANANVFPQMYPRRLPVANGADVTVTLVPYNPPITIPSAGGNFQYTITVINNETSELIFNVWTMARLPNGNLYGPVLGPVILRLPGGWSASGNLQQFIPGKAPGGVYEYIAYAGAYPGEAWGTDSFTLDKLSDGGWYMQSPATANELRGLSFPDADNGWAVSDYKEIVRTTDGGDTWSHLDDQQPYGHRYNDVCFVDAQQGWVVGYGWSLGGTILHTADGGMNWTVQYPDNGYELNSVHFIDSDTGWAVGGYVDFFGSNHKRVIEHTADGGATWSGQYWENHARPFNSVYFTDTQNGWVAGNTGAIFRTSNGGGNWIEQQSGTSKDLNGVVFVDNHRGWCVGDEGTILHTTNGGTTWSSQNPGTTAYLEAVHFVDGQTGWAAGVDYDPMRGVMLQTTDGGVTWIPQPVPEGEYILYDVFFIDANQGWAAGGTISPFSGIMLHTETGGEP